MRRTPIRMRNDFGCVSLLLFVQNGSIGRRHIHIYGLGNREARAGGAFGVGRLRENKRLRYQKYLTQICIGGEKRMISAPEIRVILGCVDDLDMSCVMRQ